MIFPCYDEPHLKATFILTLIHTKDLNALSNMPLSQSTPFGSLKTKSVFEESIKMSAYLFAFSLNDFPFLTNSPGNFSIYVSYISILKCIFEIIIFFLVSKSSRNGICLEFWSKSFSDNSK